MMQNPEDIKPVLGLLATVPSSSTPDYVSMKGYSHLTALVLVKNATTVTGSAITLKQATAVAGTAEKALAFTKMQANEDLGASDVLTEVAVESNTFTTDDTNSKNLLYRIDIDADDLDADNGFDCVRVGTGDATAATVTVLYLLSGPRYNKGHSPAAITD